MTVARSPILFTVEQIAGKKNTRVLCKYLNGKQSSRDSIYYRGCREKDTRYDTHGT